MRTLVGESKVITYGGYKDVKDLVLGDKVYTVKGQFSLVNRIEKTDCSDQVFNVFMNGCFYGIPVTGNTLSLVLDRSGKEIGRSPDNFSWTPIKNISSRTMGVYPVGGFTNNPREMDLNLIKFLSYYVFRGFTDKSKNKVVIHLDGLEALEKDIRDSLFNSYGLKMDKYTYSGETFLSVNDGSILEKCLVFGSRSKEKVIPEDFIVSLNQEGLVTFIDIFFKTSTINKGLFFKPSGSVELFLTIQRLLMKLNCFSNIYLCNSRDGEFHYYAITVGRKEYDRIFKGLSGCWFKDNSHAYIRIDKVERDSGSHTFYNVDVEGSDPSVYLNVLGVKL